MKKIESLGWGFFLIVFVLISPLCVYLVWRFTYEEIIEFQQQIGIGLFLAAGLAAVIAWASNTLLQWRLTRLREAQQAAQDYGYSSGASAKKTKGGKSGAKKKKKKR